MNESTNEPELDALLGAYALDALDPEERAHVEEYLAGNPVARDEVDELRESAASLALAPMDDVEASPEVWERISASISEEPRAFTPLRRREDRRRAMSPRVMTMLAAAAIVAIALLATQVVVLSGRNSNTGNLAAAFDRAVKQPGAREIGLKQPDGSGEVARIVVLPDGTGYLKNDGMESLSSDQTYQLWALTGDAKQPTAISAGVLGADPRAVAFHTNGDVHGFGVTVEKAPGVVSSQQPMYASASLT
jgi:anti-sigma-K factor RskA